MANLERRILTLETTVRPQDEFDGVSAAELRERIIERGNKMDEQYPGWFERLINDPSEFAQNMVRRTVMLGLLTPEQSTVLRRHSAMKRAEANDGS